MSFYFIFVHHLSVLLPWCWVMSYLSTLSIISRISLISFLVVLLNLNLLLIILAHDAHLSLTTMSRETLFLAANGLLWIEVITSIVFNLTLLVARLIVFSITSILWVSIRAWGFPLLLYVARLRFLLWSIVANHVHLSL